MTPIVKSLTPEERAVVGNIKSLLTQLEGVMGEGEPVQMCAGTTSGQSPSTGTGITKANGSTGDPQTLGPNQSGHASQKEPVNPFVAKDEGGGETAREDAETKLDELPVSTEESLEVLKSLLGIAKSANDPSLAQIRKARTPVVDPVQVETLKVLKSLTKAVAEQEFTLRALIDGKSVADELLKVEKSLPRTPVQPSSQDILAALGQLVQKSADAPQKQDAGSMSDVLGTLWA